MRVIEPEQFQRRSIKRRRRMPIVVCMVVVLCVTSAAAIWFKARSKSPTSSAPKVAQAVSAKPPQSSQSGSADTTKPKTTFKEFTNQQFVEFYSSFAYPNTHEITSPPTITGNAEADIRIQSIAEKRGYKLRSAPVSPPVKLQGDFLLQQKAVQPFLDMQAAAKKAGHLIVVTAAFRSVDDQRGLFLPRLQEQGASAEAIAAGSADGAIETTLKTVAAPGYSRHHNGFTIDIACGAVGGMAFLNTNCYKWLSENNFNRAKEYGWIPSYPQGTASTGPEPEPWEYVWVGKEALLQ